MAKRSIENVSIPEFYAGKSVFLTGGMGFLGKVIVEKLLRSCPDIDKIYLLARAKKGKSISDRLGEIVESPPFACLRESNPRVFEKIALIEGDVVKDDLGISEADLKLLRENVSIYIHSAATISFTEPLKVAVPTNLKSVRDILGLARRAKRLDAFVHVSTAFTNWFESDNETKLVEERIYPNDLDPNVIIDFVQKTPEAIVNKMAPLLLGRHVNTYTFTKHLAEKLMATENTDLPIAIVRPSMVLGSLKEPMSGWLDSSGGPTCYIYFVAQGLWRVFHMYASNVGEIVPVDTCVNMIVASAWKVGTEKTRAGPQVYHSVTGANPLTWKAFADCVKENARKYPLDNVLWYPNIRCRQSKLAMRVDAFITQFIPAYLIDFASVVTGKKPKMVALQKRLRESFDSVSFTSTQPIRFECKNYATLIASMRPSDIKEFDFDVRKIDWKQYMETYYLGARKYLWKSQMVDFGAARRRMVMLKYANYCLMGLSLAGSLWMLNGVKNLLVNIKQEKSQKREQGAWMRENAKGENYLVN